MQEFLQPEDLAASLLSASVQLVAIDGHFGSGKSTLATRLGSLMNVEVLSTDAFLKERMGAYLQHLDLEALRQRASSAGRCIIEGICMHQILSAANLVPDAFVYVKRMARWGWTDEDELVSVEPVEVHISRMKEQYSPLLRQSDGSVSLGLAEEVVRYHVQVAPHNRATHVYLRQDA